MIIPIVLTGIFIHASLVGMDDSSIPIVIQEREKRKVRSLRSQAASAVLKSFNSDTKINSKTLESIMQGVRNAPTEISDLLSKELKMRHMPLLIELMQPANKISDVYAAAAHDSFPRNAVAIYLFKDLTKKQAIIVNLETSKSTIVADDAFVYTDGNENKYVSKLHVPFPNQIIFGGMEPGQSTPIYRYDMKTGTKRELCRIPDQYQSIEWISQCATRFITLKDSRHLPYYFFDSTTQQCKMLLGNGFLKINRSETLAINRFIVEDVACYSCLTGDLLHTLKIPGLFSGVEFCSSDRFAACTQQDIQIWSILEKTCLKKIMFNHTITPQPNITQFRANEDENHIYYVRASKSDSKDRFCTLFKLNLKTGLRCMLLHSNPGFNLKGARNGIVFCKEWHNDEPDQKRSRLWCNGSFIPLVDKTDVKYPEGFHFASKDERLFYTAFINNYGTGRAAEYSQYILTTPHEILNNATMTEILGALYIKRVAQAQMVPDAETCESVAKSKSNLIQIASPASVRHMIINRLKPEPL